MDDVNKNTAKLKLGSSEVKIRDAAQLVLKVVGSANSYISQAVSLNQYASIAWAGISFLLPLFMNISTQSASLVKGLEYISSLVAQSQIREALYIKCYESRTGGYEEFQQSHRVYKAALQQLYMQILRFQAKSCCYYSNNSAFRHGLDAIKWNDWDQLVNDVRERDTEFTAIEQIWQNMQLVEERLAAETRQQSVINHLSAIETDTAASRKAAESAVARKEREELLKWLCDIDPSSNYNTAREMHEVGTNEWLVKDSEEFKAWETNDGSLLWLHGKAGSGKSVLSSSVINYLNDKYKSQPSTAIAYYYFSFSDAKKQEVGGMLASLVKQIWSCMSDAPPLIKRFRDYKTRGGRPDIKTLEAALMASISELSAVYVVVDGLDECPILGGERERLLKSLQNILLNAPEPLHVFLTSRKEQDIDLKIRTLLLAPSRTSIDLLAYQMVLNNDIRCYIDSKLANDSFASWSQSTKEKARRLLVEKADCMFQYVWFQLETLKMLSTKPDIEKALQELPTGLDATYNRILESIDAKFQPRVTNSLKWLAFSKGVLSVEQLSEIFIIDPDNDIAFDEEDRLFSPTDVLKYFSGLIISQTSIFGSRVRLVHFSVKEYLTSDRIRRRSTASAFSFTEVNAHMHIVRSCLAYLTCLSTGGGQHTHTYDDMSHYIKNLYPLASYASANWRLHLKKIPRASWSVKDTKVVEGSLITYRLDHIVILLNAASVN
ncbi:hypothetical protein TrVGV298_000780 [Trichoderma virens]|nr:hypothetical protein TrVGV298_000780 [Trichoderma virens]